MFLVERRWGYEGVDDSLRPFYYDTRMNGEDEDSGLERARSSSTTIFKMTSFRILPSHWVAYTTITCIDHAGDCLSHGRELGRIRG